MSEQELRLECLRLAGMWFERLGHKKVIEIAGEMEAFTAGSPAPARTVEPAKPTLHQGLGVSTHSR